MSENLTTRYFLDQMHTWSEQDLVEALGQGLPWHEHAAARELLIARRRSDVTRQRIPAPRSVSFRRPEKIVSLGVVLLLLGAASSFAYRWRQAPMLSAVEKILPLHGTNLFQRLGIRSRPILP